MAETAISIVAEQVVAPAGSWIKRQISYLFNFKRNVDNFNVQLQRLNGRRERIEHDVDAASRRKMQVIERDVQDWLQQVTTLNENAKPFLEETERAKMGCFFGLCPNVKARYQLSKNAEEKSNVASDLLAAQFPSVAYSPPPQGVRFSTIKGYETFESRAHHLEDIMNALKDPDVNMIGVWGMGGVGKTTLVKKAAEQAYVEKIFNVVVLSEVSLNQDLRKVQGEIAEALGFKFEAETISVRSIKLRERLQKETKILVILDNIWERLDLEELGIPFGNDHKGCKILITSRDENVLDEIGTDSLNIKVDTLDDGEAWNLFEKMAGDIVKAPNLHPIAIEIAKRCGGLPILINTVASSLRNKKDSRTWKVALRQLEKFENDQYDARAYSALEFSYNNLRSKVMKQLFLLCGLLVYTDYHAIENLLNYCRILDSFKDNDRLEDRRNKLHKLVRDLKSACLLSDAENGYIKMHDVVLKFAVSFATQKHNMFIEEYDGELEEWPKKNTVVKVSSVYFNSRIHSHIHSQELKLFILYSQNRHLEIPSSFFEGVRGIMVLDITNLIIPSLPPSLYHLNNLCTLSLERCELEDIGIIGNLVGLEILRIVNTNLSRLPEKIRQLTRLKLFNVSKCYNLKVIPPNVISSWTQLEELSMEESYVNWVAEGVDCQNACLAELKKLSKLTSLDIHIPNSDIMPNGLFSDKLERFKILIGDGWGWDWIWSRKYESSRRLKLKLSTSIHLKPDVKELLKKTEDLYLDELVDVNSVSELDREGFPRLRCLHVQNGRNFQYIVNSNARVPCNIFPGLEVLSLENLIKLEMICHGQLGVESFNKLRIVRLRRCEEINVDEPILLLNGKIVLPNLEELFLFDIGAEKIMDNNLLAMPHCFQTLRVMELSDCHKLNFLFPVGVVTSLIQLESLTVRHCKLMEGIIGGVAGQMIFPKLRILMLEYLPELKRFCTGNSIEFPSLSFTRIFGCPELKSFIFDEKEVSNDDLPPPLFDEKVKLPTIESLTICDVNLKRIWHNELAQESFCKLDHLSLYHCKNVLHIFPSNMLTRLQNLQKLEILNCESIDVIFDLEGSNGLLMHITKAPVFRKLKSINIYDCPSLKYIFPLSIGIGLQELEELDIERCGAVEKIVAMEGVEADVRFEFPNVTSLILEDLPQVRSFYPGIHTSEWPLLKKLKVYKCGNVEEGVHVEQPLFLYEKELFPHHLEELYLSWNYNMKQMWHAELQFKMLKSLEVIECHDESFPPGFFKKLPNLEQLCVSHSTLDEIFSNGETGEPSAFCTLKLLRLIDCDRLKILFPSSQLTFCNLSTLEISDCNGLTYLMSCSAAKRMMQLEILEVRGCEMMTSIVECVSHSTLDERFPNGEAGEPSAFCTLKFLRLEYCDRLKILFPSSQPTFCNLSKLEISNCNGLTYLMPCSVAKRMMQLEILEVWECEMMTSIVKCVGECEAEEDDIIFHQLKKLYINHMSSLSSFSGSAKHAFKFPSLEDVYVGSCPNLKTFCEGALSTFKLRSLHVDIPVSLIVWTYKERWNSDLNTTIQTLYKEKMTIRIQRQFRRHVAHRDFIALRMASIVIQSAVRGNIARQMFESLKGDIALN